MKIPLQKQGCVPVAHGHAVETPFVAEDALQELRILGAVHASNTAVPCHAMRLLRKPLHIRSLTKS